MNKGLAWGVVIVIVAAVAGGIVPRAQAQQAPDAEALRLARRLRAEAAYQEVKGNRVEAARLYKESLKHVPDTAIAEKAETLRREAALAATVVPSPQPPPPQPPPAPGAEPPPLNVKRPVATPPDPPPSVGAATLPPSGVAPSVGTLPVAPPAEPPPAAAVRRKVNDQLEDLFDVSLDVTGLTGEIPADSTVLAYLRTRLPASERIGRAEQDRLARLSEWSDDGPYVLRTGFARADQRVTIRVVCPERPALKPTSEDFAYKTTGRYVRFEVYEESQAESEEDEPVEWKEDSDVGTISWTPRLVEGLDRVLGPTVVGIYVDYGVAQVIDGQEQMRLAGGRHRVGWVLIANPNAPFVLDGKLHLVGSGPATPETPRPAWVPPAPPTTPAVAGRVAVITPQELRTGRLQMSRNFRRTARVQPRDAAKCVVIDGSESPAYDDISGFEFYGDGASFGFVGALGDWEFAVIDGRESAPFREVSYLRVTPDGRHHIFIGREEGEPRRETVVVDGERKGTYEGDVSSPVITPQGRFLYAIKRAAGGAHVVIDGVEGPRFDDIVYSTAQFSPDGARTVYLAERAGKRLLVLDGQEQPGEIHETDVVFSADSRHVAHTVRADGGSAVVVDGRRGPVFRDVSAPVLSADGSRIAYVAEHPTTSNRCVVVDGTVGPSAGTRWGAGRPVFSPDGTRVAYTLAQSDKEEVLLLDGRERARAADIREPGFSPDSKSLAWFEKRAAGMVVVIDGKPGTTYSDIFADDPPVFSPDSRHVFYCAKTANAKVLVMDHDEVLTATEIVPVVCFDVPGKGLVTHYNGTELHIGEVALP